MKYLLFNILLISFLMLPGISAAQVTIGSDLEPEKAAILDIKNQAAFYKVQFSNPGFRGSGAPAEILYMPDVPESFYRIIS